MSAGDHASLLAAVLKYGDVSRGGDPQLWVLLLEYLAQQTTTDVEQRVRAWGRLGFRAWARRTLSSGPAGGCLKQQQRELNPPSSSQTFLLSCVRRLVATGG